MLQLSTKGIELTINENEGVISSLKIKGKERIVATCPIFKMRFRDTDGESLFIDSTEAKTVEYLTFSGFEKLPSISAKLYVYENDGINWQIHIDGVPKEYAIEWVELPTVCLPKLIDNDYKGGRILFPYDEGVLLTDENSLPRYEAEFPMSGSHFIFPNKVCSQFIAYLFEDCGLYVGAHDTKRGFKGIDFYPLNGGVAVTIRPHSGVNYGEGYKMEFPIVWKICKREWKSPTEIYRKWFKKNLPHNLLPIKKNKALPEWYKDTPVIVTYPVRGIHDMDKMEPNALFPYTNALPYLEEIKNATNCKVMSLLMHWEGTAPWAPPYMWPPFGGEALFNEFRDALHKNGDLLGVYCSGFGYTKQSTLIEEYNCEERIKADNVLEGVCHSPANKPELGGTCCPYQRYGYDLCPASDKGLEILNEGYAPIFASGADYAQILDQNHGGGQYKCYARNHNHPPMPGEWMTSNLQRVLADWQKSAPNMLFGCESAASEPFIGGLLMSDNRFELNYPFGTPVPVYAYIYHEYVRNFMGNQCGCPFEPEWDTVRYRLAYSFSIGDIMTLTLAPNGDLMTHWGTHDFEHAPDKEKALRFIKNVMEFYRAEGEKYLYSGKMKNAPDIICEEIFIPLFRGRKYANLPRLLSSTWAAEKNKTAYIVVNPEDTEIEFAIGDDFYTAPPLNAMLIIR